MKKIILIVLFGYLAYYGYKLYSDGIHYNANNPNSLNIMITLTPANEKVKFIKDFELASNDIEGRNLHTLSREEITILANKKRFKMVTLKIRFLTNVIDSLNEQNKQKILLDSTGFRFPREGYIPKEFTLEDLIKEREKLNSFIHN